MFILFPEKAFFGEILNSATEIAHMYSFQMDKDRFAVSRGPCSWLEMHQFIGDLMSSSSSQPVKDSAQQEALRTAWETAGHEALGLKVAPAAPPAQARQPPSKMPPGYCLQPLPESGERSGEAGSGAQQLQHRTCNCPACPFSSSSGPTFQTLRPRENPSSQTHPPQSDQARQSKESSTGPVSLGLCLGLGLSLEEETGDPSIPCNTEPEPPQQRQNPDRGTTSQNPNPNPNHNPAHHNPPHVPTFPCLCCHRGFQTCAQLILPAPVPCLSCQRTFQTCAQLLRHQQGHAQQEGLSQHPCMHCSASFPRPSQLLQHQRSQHASKAGGFLCTECGRAFNSHSNLRIHLNVHTGARPYACTDCGKSFSQSGALKIHRRIHTGERPYTCTYCGRGFPHLAGIRAHQRTHTGEKPYRCPQCGKCFTQSGALKIHLRIHTGERPFICGLCGKGFSNRSGIRFHHRTVHGITSEDGLSLGAATHAGLSLLSSAIAGVSSSPNAGLGPVGSPSISPVASLSPNTNTCDSPASDPNADVRPGSSIATVSSSLSSPGSSFSLDPQPPAGKDAPSGSESAERKRKELPYACEDCGLRFRDAPSRNKHQELEHYCNQEEEEEEEEGEGEGEELGLGKEGGVGETVESIMQ
ncbi:hypothetical protein MATL_G00126670 [Megalops atlanticus]|uniref:C2H2-type domain-containing protein n=1 Tax=Megalops atlanticus TaxID=7932 RepID=A0A9D3PXS8_MEGAT|nr:hypothetical protein MATL_G00126670 [Megalops atlanticus]